MVPEPTAAAFVLSVDELGSYLVVGADELVMGHARGAGVDLPFVADVGVRHARWTRALSFRGGVTWSVSALDGERVLVGGEAIGEAERPLGHGERVELGVNLRLTYWQPDPASTTAVLQLERGVDCLGNQGIVLLGEGGSGELRLGASTSCALRAFTLEGELGLRRESERLVLEGRGLERFRALSSTGELIAPDSEHVLGLPLPLRERLHLQLGPPSESGPPFSIALAPLGSV